MSLSVEKNKYASRTTSSDELHKKKGKSKTAKISNEHFKGTKSPRDSVELTKKKVSPVVSKRKPSIESSRVSAESSTSSNYSQEQSEPRVRPEAFQVVQTLTDQQYQRVVAFKNYEEQRNTHDTLSKKELEGKPLTENEQAKLEQAGLELVFAIYQYHFLKGLPVDRNPYGIPFCSPDEGFNFFSPELKREYRDLSFRELNEYLNSSIGLLQGQEHVESNAAKMAHFEKFKKADRKTFDDLWKPMVYSKDRTKDHKVEYNAHKEKHQKQLGYLFDFERRVRLLLMVLSKELDGLKNRRLKQCCEKITDFCTVSPALIAQEASEPLSSRELDKLAAQATAKLTKKVSAEIDSYYRKGQLLPLLVDKARDIILCYQFYNPAGEVLMAPQAAEAWGVTFSSVKIKDQKVDWTRVIDGGRVWFLDKDGNALLLPFELPAKKEDYPAYLDQYVTDCQTVLGHSLRQDGPMMVQMCEFADEEAIAAGSPIVGKTKLDAQKRIMDYLAVVMDDTPRYKAYAANMASKLTEWNRTRGEGQGEDVDAIQVEQMTDILMKLYRAPYQTLVTGPTTHLIRAFQHIYPSLKSNAFIKSLSGDEHTSNRIEIQFMPFSVDIVYSTPSLICADGTDATMVMTQKMSLKTSRGGEKLADPVTVEFLYEIPEDLSENDQVLLQKSIDKINFTLNAIGYDSMREHKRIKPKKD